MKSEVHRDQNQLEGSLMLTRIEISGFKSYDEFGIDLGPHAIVLGANGVGKSNLFDALRLLAGLARGPVHEAVRDLRGRPEELFSFDARGRPSATMVLAVEVLVPPTLVDPFEATVDLTNTRIRYEVVLAQADGNGVGELLVQRERAYRIPASEDRWRPWGSPPSRAFRQAFIRRTNRSDFLHTEGGEFRIHQEGGSGRTRRLPASRAHATALSTVTSADEFPHLHALRAELASWRFLQLDPTSIRDPNRTSWALHLEPDGRNLGRVLDRIRAETATHDQPEGVLAEIAADLQSIVDGVTGILVEPDEASQDYRIQICMGQQPVPRDQGDAFPNDTGHVSQFEVERYLQTVRGGS